MAKKAGKGGRRRPSAAAGDAQRAGDPRTTAIAAALRLAASRGWAGVSLAEVAAEAGLPMSELYALYPSKQAILDAFSRQVDDEVLKAIDAEATEGGARDRLFDVVMRRLDVLAPHRDGLAAIARANACDPVALLCGARQLRRSMAAMLEAAGLSASGLGGILRIKGLSAIYLATLRTWLGDDSDDKARTMATLDQALRRAEGWVGFVSRRRRARPAAEAA